MAHIRTFAELEALPPTQAEWKLINTTKAGELCTLGDGFLPKDDEPDPSQEIRAEVLRYLILGGCEDFLVDETGVMLEGAVIKGSLDLNFVSSKSLIGLINSCFNDPIHMVQTKCKMLSLEGSHFAKLTASGIEVAGNLDLTDTHSTSCVWLKNAKIGGQLILFGAQLTSSEDYALNVQDAQITGGIFLHPAVQDEQEEQRTNFNAKGGLSLVSSTIGGLFAQEISVTAQPDEEALRAANVTITGPVKLDGSAFGGQVNLTGALITGDLTCKKVSFNNPNETAFVARRMKVEQSFIWRKDTKANGKVILDGAHVAELDDNPSSWPDADNLSLDGFTYGRIAEYTTYDETREKWLRNGSLVDGIFFPQPYTQYAKFLRDTGHDAQARQVLLAREILVRKHERQELPPVIRLMRSCLDRLQEWFVGHGHLPFRSLNWLGALIILTTLFSHLAWTEGSFAPNSGPVLVSDGWQSLQSTETNPAKVWSGDEEPARWRPSPFQDLWHTHAPGRDWETFNSVAYAADVVIPLINFGQTEAWAPSTTRGGWGWHLWWARWVFTVLGWIVTALGAAAITGIIRRE